MNTSRIRTSWLLSGVLVFGCGGSSSVVETMGSDHIGAAGGTALAATTSAVDGASVSIPAGALSAAVTITVGEGAPVGTLPSEAAAQGPVVLFGPEGQTFTTPVTITLPTTGTANAVFTRAVGEAWTLAPGGVYDAVHHVMTVQAMHFSEWVPALAPVTDAGVTDGGTDGGAACDTGETACGSFCVNPQSDMNNCGACGNVCPAGTTCALGVCVMGATDAGLVTDAGPVSDGGAVSSDGGTVSDGGSASADASLTCAAGETLCGSACANLASSTSNCGACGDACPSGDVCTAGVCMP